MPLFGKRSSHFLGGLKRRWRRREASGGLRDRAGWDQRLILSLSRTRLPTWRQIRHLPEVLSSNDSLRLKIGTLLLAAGAAILGARFYFANTVMAPAVGGEIVEGVVGTPRSLNPILSLSNDVDNDLTRLVFSRLFAPDGNGNLVPDLVETSSVSDDQKTYTFTLRQDVRWHDGEPATADDVVFTLGLIQDPAWKSPLFNAFKDVSVEQSDAKTVRLTLNEPFAPFLSRLTFGVLPKHVWKDVAPQNALQSEFNLKPVGSGPFKFASLKRDKRGFILSYTLSRHGDYYRDAPFLENLTLKFYPDYSAAVEALRKRQIESLSFIPHDMRDDIRDLAQVIPISLELPQYNAVFFNRQRNELLKDKDVRRALIMAIDKGRIILDVLDGDGRPLDGPALPGYTGLLGSHSVPFNLTEAGVLLESLGWKIDPQDGIRKKTIVTETPKKKKEEAVVPLKLTLTVVDQPESLSVAEIVKNGWRAVGVDASITAVPASEIHRTVIKPREYEALLYGQLLAADSDPYPFWHSSQIQDPGLNLAMLADRDADNAIEAAQKTGDPAGRQEKYKTFLEVLARELPAAFLYSPSYTYPFPSTIKGFSGTRAANPADRFASVTSWYLKMKRVWK